MILGTRGSALALWQARHVARALSDRSPATEIVERIIRTEGDELSAAGQMPRADRGVFVGALEEALAAGTIDLAVHSLKDLPTAPTEELTLAAILLRHDPRDALVTLRGGGLSALLPGARVGTGSPRRCSQLLHRRPDLACVGIQGNIDTRLRRLHAGDVDALVLAVAGLERLGVGGVRIEPLDPDLCLPAAGQGALAIQTRVGDRRVVEACGLLDHWPTRIAVDAERAVLRRLGGGCLAPATAFATLEGDRLRIEARVGSADGRCLLMEREVGHAQAASSIAVRLAERLLVAGARGLLDPVAIHGARG